MKKIKIFFTLLLVIMLSFTKLYADEMNIDEKYVYYGEFLKDLGLILGDENGNLNQFSNLSREEAVVIILNMLDETKNAQYYEYNVFVDIDDDSWSAPYVNYAASKGIVSGIGDSRFAPKENVTVKQLYSLFLRANGYSADWATEDVMAKADQYSLSYDLDRFITGNDAAKRGDAFIIFANAIMLPINPDIQYNYCILTDVLSVDPQYAQELVKKYDYLEFYLPENYEANYDFLY